MIKKEQIKYLESFIDVYEHKGVSFKDLSRIYSDKYALKIIIDEFKKKLKDVKNPYIIACEARGFIIGSMLAYEMGAPIGFARKKGKLPGEVVSQEYTLEYGTDTLEIQKSVIDSINVLEYNVVIIDDILATGGTVSAIAKMLVNTYPYNYLFIGSIKSLYKNASIRIKYASEHPFMPDIYSILDL